MKSTHAAMALVVIGALAVAAVLLYQNPAEAPSAPPASTPITEEDPPFTVIEQTEALSAATLPGTEWRYGPYTFVFHRDGMAVINDGVPGEWRVVGDTVIIAAMNQEMRGQLHETHLLFDGQPAKRIQLKEKPKTQFPHAVQSTPRKAPAADDPQ